jgi:hypothetical protein
MISHSTQKFGVRSMQKRNSPKAKRMMERRVLSERTLERKEAQQCVGYQDR